MELDRETLHVLNIVVFVAVFVVHAARLLMGLDVYVAGYEIPLWLNGGALIIAGLLIWQNWIKTSKNRYTVLKIAIGLLVADILGIIYFWYRGIEFLGISGNRYGVLLIIDLAIIAILGYFLKKK